MTKNIFLKCLFAAGLSLGCFSQGSAVENNYQVSESSGKLLEFPVGVRASGMGGAFVGVSDDVNGIFWNPAGLAQVGDRELNLGYTNLYSLITLESLVYGQPFAGGVIALGVNYADYGPVEKFGLDEHQNPIPLDSSLTPHALFGNLAWATSLSKYFYLGVAVKALQENYEIENRTMAALDAGAYFITGIRGLKLGLSAQNLQIPYMRGSLPVVLRAGMSYLLPTVWDQDRFTAAVDFNLPTVSAANTAVGAEYWIQDIFALRAGYGFSEKSQDDRLLGFSVGASIKFYFVQIDYAFLPNSELGDTHRISLLTRFAGQSRKSKTSELEKKDEGNSAPKRYFYQYLFSTE